MSSFIDPLDREEARKMASEAADRQRDLSFPDDEKNSFEANGLWLQVFWAEFNRLVNP